MPDVSRKKGRLKQCRENSIEEDDEEIVQRIALSNYDNHEENENLSTNCVKIIKMKLNSFLKDHCRGVLHSHINRYVLLGNRILGEAYALANFHVLRILTLNKDDLLSCFPAGKSMTHDEIGRVLPSLDKKFFYTCLVACSSCKVRENTLGESLSQSVKIFDSKRYGCSSEKPDFFGMTQILSDLSITMATMTTNHIQMNIGNRITEYVKANYGNDLKGFIPAIVRSLTSDIKITLEKIFPTSQQNQRSHKAKEIANYLRSFIPQGFNIKFSSHTHKLLPLYYVLLDSIERKRNEKCQEIKDREENDNGKIYDAKSKIRTRLPRTFNLLPIKNSFTLGYIPFSNMTVLGILKKLKIEDFKYDGRFLSKEEVKNMWGRSFNLNTVETRNTLFDCRILSDGYGVSIQMEGTTSDSSIRSNQNQKDETILNFGRRVSVDPGITDVVTTTDSNGVSQSFSSAKYYEHAGFNYSERRTQMWNDETGSETKSIPTSKTAKMNDYSRYVESYMQHLPGLLRHRASNGYRQMRFLRYTKRQKAIREICDFIAHPGEMSVVGFGDWNGGARSCISRRTSGPLKEIKQMLQESPHVKYHGIDEFRTSQTCCACHNRLTNMRAYTTRVRRKRDNGGLLQEEKVTSLGKVHKVLHCTSGKLGDSLSCGMTWDRDVNASRNIMELLMFEIAGKERPKVFCRS